MRESIIDQNRGPNITEDLYPLVDDFFQGQSGQQYCDNFNHLLFLFTAIGLHSCWYLDDWDLNFSNKIEISLNDHFRDKAEINAIRAIIHKFVRFVHSRRPFKHGLPI